MMSRILIMTISILLIPAYILWAQPDTGLENSTLQVPEAALQDADEEMEEEADKWEHNMRLSLTGSQSTYRNWSQGGTDNISVLASTVYTSEYKKDNLGYRVSVNLRYGQSRIGEGDFVKSDDVIRVRNQARRLFRDERYSAIFNVNFETQFDKGYDNPIPDEGETRNVISRFFAPAYLSQTLGVSYNPDSHFRFETGLAMKQTFVTDTDLSERYGLPEGDSFRNEAGFSVLFGYERRIMESIYYSGYVETFSNVNKSLLSSDVLFVNEISGRINRYISANIEFALAYNDDITDELQVKQNISVGFSYSFFGSD